jgi:triosephosphate isomerase
MLTDLGCKYVLIGHSETRSELLTTSFDTAHKIEAALRNELLPMLCVGFEPQIDGENINFEELKDQLVTAFEPNIEGLSGLEEILVAYEPTWAIGTGKTPTVEIVEKVINFVLTTIDTNFGKELSQKTRVLYGGSVNDTNISEFAKSDKIAGFLIGGASLDPIKVANIVNALI